MYRTLAQRHRGLFVLWLVVVFGAATFLLLAAVGAQASGLNCDAPCPDLEAEFRADKNRESRAFGGAAAAAVLVGATSTIAGTRRRS